MTTDRERVEEIRAWWRKPTREGVWCEDDAVMISDAAVDDVPILLSEIDRLRERNKQLQHDLELAHMTVGNLGERCEELEAALERIDNLPPASHLRMARAIAAGALGGGDR